MYTITCTLNGRAVSGRQGNTILELAQNAGIYIPTLCNDPALKPVGACRICLVEDENSGRLLASCVTPIAPDMRIRTDSPTVLDARRVILKLLIANHPESCLVCDKGNRCRLRQLAAEMGIAEIDYDRMPSMVETQDLNPFIKRDLSKCILCAKCIRADQELVVVGAIDYLHRGFDAHPATLMERPLEASECTFCGTCVSLCPTGALSEKLPVFVGTAGSRTATICGYCGCGCSLWAHTVDNRVVYITPKAEDSMNGPTLCVRGHYGGDYLNNRDRLTSPLIHKDGELKPASWDEALDLIADRLKGIVEQWGPEAVGVIGSARYTNEENYLLQKIARSALGTPNVDGDARIHAMAGVIGLREVLGVGAATNPLEDIERAEAIFIIGAQPTESHPVAGYHIKRAVRFNGAKLIHAGYMDDALALMADVRLRVRPGGEYTLLLGLLKALSDSGAQGVRDAEGWEAFYDTVQSVSFADVEEITGVSRSAVKEAAAILKSTARCALVFGAGVTQSPDGLEDVKAIGHAALLIGCLGVSGGGIFPLDKAANTQGACDMGAVTEWLPGYANPDGSDAKALFKGLWGKEPPSARGMTLFEMLDAARKGTIKALYFLGEDATGLFPELTADALRNLEFLAVQGLFPTDAAKAAHVVFPGAAYAEKDGTFTNLERRIQRLRPAAPPPGDAKPDWWILSSLLHRMTGRGEYESVSDVMKEIAKAVPDYAGVQYSRLERGSLFQPCEDIEALGEAILFRGGVKKVTLGLNGMNGNGSPAAADPYYPFIAIQSDTHFHHGTLSGRSRRLSSILPTSRILMHPDDIASLNLQPGSSVRALSRWGSLTAELRDSEETSPGRLLVISGPDGYAMSRLHSGELDRITKTPSLAYVPVRLEPIGGDNA